MLVAAKKVPYIAPMNNKSNVVGPTWKNICCINYCMTQNDRDDYRCRNERAAVYDPG
tara:strand:- start:963 stop:1133 length:171 start_codon:yes stop_codon:yes gene_type:complete